MDRKPLNTWVHPQDRLTLLGDACHSIAYAVNDKASQRLQC